MEARGEAEQSLFFPQHFQLSPLAKTAKLGILLFALTCLMTTDEMLGLISMCQEAPEMANEWEQGACVLL